MNKENKFISGLIKFFVVGLFFIGVFFVFTQNASAETAFPGKAYHCFLKIPDIGQDICLLFFSQNDTEAEQFAINQCKTKSFTEGTCPATTGTEIPTGKSAEELQREAARELNPAGINQPTDLIGKAIRLLMAFIGSISLVLYVFAGILWLSAGGAPDRVDKAKKVIVWTTLGVVVMLASYMLVNFVFKSLGL